MENLAYALVQVVHNFGAAGVVGGAVFALWPVRQPPAQQDTLAWLVLLAWTAQIASGVGLGLVSWFYYGQLPDIHGIAVLALSIKVASAAVAVVLTGLFLWRSWRWTDRARARLWFALVLLGVTALAAAAFLRWFA